MPSRLVSIALLGCAAVTGCNTSGIVELNPAEIRPAVEPAPVAVNVYYDRALLAHSCTGDNGYIAYSWTFELGPPSVEMFNPIFTALFETVEFDPTESPLDSPRDRIELYLKNFTGCSARWPIVGNTLVEISYEAIATSADGVELARWSGRGGAESAEHTNRPDDPFVDIERLHLGVLTDIAMRKAAADFIVNFENSAAVRAWLTR